MHLQCIFVNYTEREREREREREEGRERTSYFHPREIEAQISTLDAAAKPMSNDVSNK